MGGSFDITPSEGEALSTKFTLKSMGWVDTDTPVVYTFVYLDPSTGAETPIGVDKRDSGTMSDVTLPAGSAAKNHSLVVKAYVFDSLGASTHASARSSSRSSAGGGSEYVRFVQRSKFVAHHVAATGNTASSIDLIMQFNARQGWHRRCLRSERFWRLLLDENDPYVEVSCRRRTLV